MSSSPRRARSVAPSTRVRPPVPTTSARDDPRRGAALDHLDPAEAALDEPASFAPACAQRQLDRPPAVLRRDVVVRVGDRLQPRLRLGAEVGVLDVLGAPAGGGEEERDDGLAVVGDDLAARGGDRVVGRSRLRRHAAVDLRAGVGVLVEARAALGRGDRVGARGHGLRLERLGRPRRRRLARHDARDVVLERDRVDRVEAAEGVGPELERCRGSCPRRRASTAPSAPETWSGAEKVAIRLPAADRRSTCEAPWRRAR